VRSAVYSSRENVTVRLRPGE